MITINKHTIHQWLLILFAFSIPFFPLFKIIVPILIGLLIVERVVFFFSIKEQISFNKGLSKNQKYISLIFASFFVIHLIGMLYTNNQISGWIDVETKLALFILPFLFLFYPTFTKHSFQQISLAFVSGCFIICMYFLLISGREYLTTKEPVYFFYEKLSHFHHPSYLAMYLNWCIIILAYFLFKNQYEKLSGIFVFLIIFFSLFVLLLASKTGIILLAIMLFSIISICLALKKIKITLLILSVISIAVVSYITIVPTKNNRILVAANDLLANKKDASTHTRFIIWESAVGIIKENWIIGVGTGDLDNALIERYKLINTHKMKKAIEKTYNAHNQYIQTFLALGIIGELILFGCLLIPLYWSIKQRNYLYIYFLIVVGFNLLSESMLERQAGIIFYAFFNILLCKSEAVNLEL